MHVLANYLVSTILIARALGQTPPDTQPITNDILGVSYGATNVVPGIELPLTVPRSGPIITRSSSANQTYQLLIVDLSIRTATLNTSSLVPDIQLPLAAGISTGRTTRLHFWQTGLRFSTNGTLINTTSPIAFYQPPAPPAGDIAHTYVFYLFEQEDGFTPPPEGNPFSQALVNKGSSRTSFNVNNLAEETGIGALVGATYFLAQNTSGTPRATGSGTGSVSSPTTVPFPGGASQHTLGFPGVLVTAFAIMLALRFATC